MNYDSLFSDFVDTVHTVRQKKGENKPHIYGYREGDVIIAVPIFPLESPVEQAALITGVRKMLRESDCDCYMGIFNCDIDETKIEGKKKTKTIRDGLCLFVDNEDYKVVESYLIKNGKELILLERADSRVKKDIESEWLGLLDS